MVGVYLLAIFVFLRGEREEGFGGEEGEKVKEWFLKTKADKVIGKN